MIDQSVPFAVRRARLLLGLTRMQFAELYGVDVGNVYRWELGLACPSAEIWARLRTATVKAASLLDEDLVRASPLYKFIADIDNLTRPVAISKGILEALEDAGASHFEHELIDYAETIHNSPAYQISGTRALEIIQVDPKWRSGQIVYAEFHSISHTLHGVWVDGMAAPLRERTAAIIEFAPSKRGAEGGFWVHPVAMEDMPFNRAQ